MQYIFTAILLALCDRFLKLYIIRNIAFGERVPFIRGVLDLTHVENTGAAFGRLQGMRWPLVAISAAAVIVIFALILTRKVRRPFAVWSLTLMAGGALGNLVDRLLYGRVVDMFLLTFVDFAILIWRLLYRRRRHRAVHLSDLISGREDKRPKRLRGRKGEHGAAAMDEIIVLESNPDTEVCARTSFWLLRPGHEQKRRLPPARRGARCLGKTLRKRPGCRDQTIELRILRRSSVRRISRWTSSMRTTTSLLLQTQGACHTPRAGARERHVFNAAVAPRDSLSVISGEDRPGIVHRIDKDTSGLIICAKNDFAHVALAGRYRRIPREGCMTLSCAQNERRQRDG